MQWIIKDINNLPIILCGLFYSLLCIFSIVTGLIYMSGKRKLNPLELSDKFIKKLNTKEKLNKFTKTMGFVTFIVGIIQGLTAFALFKGYNKGLYYLALGFTLFSIASVLFKLKGKISTFPILKFIFYIIIFVILLQKNTLVLFF